MNRATRVVASVFGVYAGLLGAAHGALETAQGSVAPSGAIISAIGPPCQPDAIWHGCFPALTVVPNYLVTGLLAILVSLTVVAWAALLVDVRRGGLVLALLSLLMLPVGGGIIPVLIGVVAGAVGTRIKGPLAWWRNHLSDPWLGLLATIWPWPLIGYSVWVPAEWVLGRYANAFMLERGYLFLFLEFGWLLLSIVSAFAYDIAWVRGRALVTVVEAKDENTRRV